VRALAAALGLIPSRGQLRQLRRMVLAFLSFVGIGLLLLLVFSPQAESFCDDHGVGCGLVTGFISTALILLAGYFFLFTWTLRRARRAYVDRARERPEQFFVTPPRLRADMVGREPLTRAVASESAFARRGAPIVVVGEPGSGKTTFLLGLLRHLAHEGAVPVLVPLRGASAPLDLRALAQQEFYRRVDPVVRSEGDAQRIWRRLTAEGSIVVLADGLDEVAPGATRHERDYVIRAALVTARNDRLPVVVTSRPEAVPPGAPVSQFELGDLEEDEALAYLRDSVHLRSAGDVELIRAIVAAGRITHTPFYLNIVSSLYRAGRLARDSETTRDALLVRLLDTWTELVEDESFFADLELGQSRRRKIVGDLAAIAYAMTLDEVLDSSLTRVRALFDDPANGIPSSSSDSAMVVEGAARLDLVRVFPAGEDTGIRFNHAISQAYLTSLFLRDAPGRWKLLIERAVSPEMCEALVMWSALHGDRAETRSVCEALVERAGGLRDDRALMLVVTAAEIASTVGLEELPQLAGEAEAAAWEEATPRAKVAAVRRLERRTCTWAYTRLYEATRDRNYRVRWSATTAIVAGGAEAVATLRPTFRELLAFAEEHPAAEWRDATTHDVSVLGWILPALSGRVDDDELAEDVRRLVRVVRRGVPLGTEASAAQGFKLGAAGTPTSALVQTARELADHCAFWYARIVLLQAITVAALSGAGERGDALAFMRRKANDHREHPFVRAAAALCARAIRSPRDRHRYIWEDESAVIRRSGSLLHPDAAALAGDMVLLLNVTEQGADEEREQRKERTYGENHLPYCLSASRDRRELFDGCHETCRFELCPYPSTAERSLARGELSQAFCRRQVDALTGLSRLQGVWRRPPTRRWSRSGRTALARFWAEMERHAA
jgi:NACHT domain